MGIIPNWSARAAAELDRRARAEPRDDLNVTRPGKPDLRSDPAIQAAIKQREAQVIAEAQARSFAAVKAQHEAGAERRIAAIQRRIFNQVASVGGIRTNGRS
ncbi:hypothetical protein [Thiocapsa sp.]|uniref:hypothetical protein n=1 Tax=Thiocapsa sp. TaxID=2024551 RepID=UPI0035946941